MMASKKFSITTKIILLGLSLVAVTAFLIGSIFYVGNNQGIVNQFINQMAERNQFLGPLITRNIDELITKTTKLSELISQEKRDTSMTPLEQRQKILTTLEHNLRTNNRYKKIDWTDNQSLTTYTFYRDEDGEVLISRRLLEKEILSKSEMHVTSPHLLQYANKLVEPHIPVVEGMLTLQDIDNKVMGSLNIALDFSDNLKVIDQISNPQMKIFIVDAEGNYLYHKLKEKTFAKERGLSGNIIADYEELKGIIDFKQNQRVVPKIMDQDGTALYYIKVPLTKATNGPWVGVVSLADYQSTLNEFKRVRMRSLFMAFALILLTSVITIYFSKVLTKNLEKITDVATRYTHGETNLSIDVKSNDEIGILAHTLQGMIFQVNERTRRIKRSEEKANLAKEEVETAYLENQALFENIKTQKAEIERISKDKDDLMAIVSHDLKNPLAVIKNGMDLALEERANLSEDQIKIINQSKRGAEFGLALITDLLELTRIENGISLNYSSFNLSSMVNECITFFADMAVKKNIKIIPQNLSDMMVLADERKILQVLNNLIGNAVKFTPENGEITISGKLTNRKIRGKRKEQETITISVTDTGVGIPADKINNIFNKYEQARLKDREIGTGLGLSICKNIADIHNGKIEVHSTEGVGTTFSLILPSYDRIQNETQTPDFKRKILYFSNTQSQATMIADYIPRKIEIEMTNSIDRIIKGITDNEFDLLVIKDIDAEFSSFEILNKLRARREIADFPIIVESQKLSKDLVEKIKYKADDFFHWPCQHEILQLKFAQFTDIEIPTIKSLVATPLDTDSFSTPVVSRISSVHNNDSQVMRLLLADDSEDVHQLIPMMLKNLSVTIDHAKNGREAIDFFAQNVYDLILMDMNMPVLDGLTATKVIRAWEQKKSLPITAIFATTASSDEETRRKCLAFGFSGFLNKPFDKKHLQSLLLSLHDSTVKKVA